MASDDVGSRPGQSHQQVVSVGLTGNIGSGKSTVARLFEERGARVIDSDALARQATADAEVLERIREELGAQYVLGGELDRARTARLVFGNDEARRRLEGIIHPWVRARSRAIQEELVEAKEPPPAIVHDIPLLFENRLERGFDLVVVVSAPLELRIARTAERSKLSEEEFKVRDRAQWPLERKARLADHVIENSGDLDQLRAQVDSLWQRITAS